MMYDKPTVIHCVSNNRTPVVIQIISRNITNINIFGMKKMAT